MKLILRNTYDDEISNNHMYYILKDLIPTIFQSYFVKISRYFYENNLIFLK